MSVKHEEVLEERFDAQWPAWRAEKNASVSENERIPETDDSDDEDEQTESQEAQARIWEAELRAKLRDEL